MRSSSIVARARKKLASRTGPGPGERYRNDSDTQNNRLPLTSQFEQLLAKVASRRRGKEPLFDAEHTVAATAVSLRKRLSGLEWNLLALNPVEQRCLMAFTPDDWATLHNAAAANGGEGIAYIELDAELLAPVIVHNVQRYPVLEGLQRLLNLECVSVWAPADGGPMDLGELRGKNGRLRINILGQPKNPLDITVPEGVVVQGKTASSLAIQRSRVFTRHDTGTISPDPVPLAVPQPAQPRQRLMPCVGDMNLLLALTEQLQQVVAKQPQFARDRFDAGSVARAIVLCGRFDEEDNFGFDFKGLTPQQLRCALALPAMAWEALRHSAEKAGESIEWIDLHARRRISELLLSRNDPFPFPTLLGMPCAGDRELIAMLAAELDVAAGQSQPGAEPFDSNAIAWAIVRCGRLEKSGQFGFDLRSMSPQQVSCMQALSGRAWKLLQSSAARAGFGIAWLDLPDDFKINDSLMESLKQLSPLWKLSVAAPAKVGRLRLDKLQGGAVRLRELQIRTRPGQQKFGVVVQSGVKVGLSGGVEMDKAVLKQSSVFYVNASGLTESEVSLLQTHEAALSRG